MATFDIWAEGYRSSDGNGEAILLGTEDAATFAEAVATLAQNDREFACNLSADGLTYWGCRLFDNETAARQSFG